MTMTKTWEAVAAGVGLDAWLAVGLCVAGAWATALGPQAAGRHREITRATNLILLRPYDPNLDCC